MQSTPAGPSVKVLRAGLLFAVFGAFLAVSIPSFAEEWGEDPWMATQDNNEMWSVSGSTDFLVSPLPDAELIQVEQRVPSDLISDSSAYPPSEDGWGVWTQEEAPPAPLVVSDQLQDPSSTDSEDITTVSTWISPTISDAESTGYHWGYAVSDEATYTEQNGISGSSFCAPVPSCPRDALSECPPNALCEQYLCGTASDGPSDSGSRCPILGYAYSKTGCAEGYPECSDGSCSLECDRKKRCVPYAYSVCTSGSNICGMIQEGKYDCEGNCSASIPSNSQCLTLPSRPVNPPEATTMPERLTCSPGERLCDTIKGPKCVHYRFSCPTVCSDEEHTCGNGQCSQGGCCRDTGECS